MQKTLQVNKHVFTVYFHLLKLNSCPLMDWLFSGKPILVVRKSKSTAIYDLVHPVLYCAGADYIVALLFLCRLQRCFDNLISYSTACGRLKHQRILVLYIYTPNNNGCVSL